MTLQQRAIVKTLITVGGIATVGFVVALISTTMSQAMFFGLLAVAFFVFMTYLIYSFYLSELETAERFSPDREVR